MEIFNNLLGSFVGEEHCRTLEGQRGDSGVGVELS